MTATSRHQAHTRFFMAQPFESQIEIAVQSNFLAMISCLPVNGCVPQLICQLLQVHLHLIPSHALPTYAMDEAEMY